MRSTSRDENCRTTDPVLTRSERSGRGSQTAAVGPPLVYAEQSTERESAIYDPGVPIEPLTEVANMAGRGVNQMGTSPIR